MAVKVVDASAIAALVFGEPVASDVTARLSDSTLVAPALLPFEIASVCLKKMRRYPEQREALLAAQRLFGQMAINPIEVDFTEVLMMAEHTGLTSYDASYLWLSRKLNAELVTLDKQLARAAITV
jgi:predicted nucleic acid-binding protein